LVLKKTGSRGRKNTIWEQVPPHGQRKYGGFARGRCRGGSSLPGRPRRKSCERKAESWGGGKGVSALLRGDPSLVRMLGEGEKTRKKVWTKAGRRRKCLSPIGKRSGKGGKGSGSPFHGGFSWKRTDGRIVPQHNRGEVLPRQKKKSAQLHVGKAKEVEKKGCGQEGWIQQGSPGSRGAVRGGQSTF